MDPRGVEAASARLDRAREEAAKLRGPRAKAKKAWGEFLIALGGVYAKLEQASKASAASKSWYHARRLERASDDLLKYLHHARNVEEHGIAPVTKEGHRSVSIEPGGMVQFTSDGVDTWHITAASPGAIKPQDPELLLARVTDRHGTWAPPLVHLGEPIEPVPTATAEAALSYAEAMLSDARRLTPASLKD